MSTRARYRVRRAPDDPVVRTLATEDFVTIENFLPDDVFDATCTEVERRPVGPASGGVLVEDITIGDYSLADEQTRLHVDSVFHTHKVWLYLTDVTVENAPLVYVPRSHHLDAVRLRAEYRDSVDPSRCVDPSRRVPDAETERRGLTPQVVTCPKNTLVIADTCGHHARAIGRDGGHRRALHMFFRSNPFRYPWPRTRRTLGSVRRAVVGRRPG